MGSDSSSEESPERRFRTLFISDVHLGARGSQAAQVLDFLKAHDPDPISPVGDKAYDFPIQMNRLVTFFRRMFGVPYWSLSQWAKLKVKNAVNYIGAFEKTLAGEARRHGPDGVICGHIHSATIRDEHGIRYMNCGDWVESCTALAEHEAGRFEIITWTDPLRRAAPVPRLAARAP